MSRCIHVGQYGQWPPTSYCWSVYRWPYIDDASPRRACSGLPEWRPNKDFPIDGGKTSFPSVLLADGVGQNSVDGRRPWRSRKQKNKFPIWRKKCSTAGVGAATSAKSAAPSCRIQFARTTIPIFCSGKRSELPDKAPSSLFFLFSFLFVSYSAGIRFRRAARDADNSDGKRAAVRQSSRVTGQNWRRKNLTQITFSSSGQRRATRAPSADG